MSEHSEQTAFIQWADMQTEHPELHRMFAIPNGAKLPFVKNKHGKRYSPEAMKLKGEGLRKGVPDLFLPCQRGGYAGLFLEAKIHPNKPSLEQVEYLDWLHGQGYAAVVCYGFEGLKETAEWYLGLDEMIKP